MDLFINELSFHGQFSNVSALDGVFGHLMKMRVVAGRFGRTVYCSRALSSVQAIPGMSMSQILQHLPEGKRRSVLGWMNRGGPFWNDLQKHGRDDYLESQGAIVTDTTVGEAGYRNLGGIACGLVSVAPSDWDYSPITVIWRRNDHALEDRCTELKNWRTAAELEEALRGARTPMRSWKDLQVISTNRFANITFGGESFDPLTGVPFSKSSADRIVFLLGILDRFSRAFDATRMRTPDGQRMYQDYFTGDRALFSDSSDTEKSDFRKQLTFHHPSESGKTLFCTWHGKVSHMALRLHYSWSGRPGAPVYVVYVGPKITRR